MHFKSIKLVCIAPPFPATEWQYPISTHSGKGSLSQSNIHCFLSVKILLSLASRCLWITSLSSSLRALRKALFTYSFILGGMLFLAEEGAEEGGGAKVPASLRNEKQN